MADAADEPVITDLIVGGGNEASAIDAGDVVVWTEGMDAYVKYVTAEGWCLKETHLQVAASLAGIPQTNGNPNLGQFENKDIFKICKSEHVYQVPIEWYIGYGFHVAAQAVVEKTSPPKLKETAWGDGYAFSGNNWAMYFLVVKRVPILLTPEEGAILDNGRYDFQDYIIWDFDWTDVPDAFAYRLYVKSDNALNPVIDTYVYTSEYHHQSRSYIGYNNLSGWTWKVQANTFTHGWSTWSKARSFRAEPPNTDPPW
jgi:hypothetical protein